MSLTPPQASPQRGVLRALLCIAAFVILAVICVALLAPAPWGIVALVVGLLLLGGLTVRYLVLLRSFIAEDQTTVVQHTAGSPQPITVEKSVDEPPLTTQQIPLPVPAPTPATPEPEASPQSASRQLEEYYEIRHIKHFWKHASSMIFAAICMVSSLISLVATSSSDSQTIRNELVANWGWLITLIAFWLILGLTLVIISRLANGGLLRRKGSEESDSQFISDMDITFAIVCYVFSLVGFWWFLVRDQSLLTELLTLHSWIYTVVIIVWVLLISTDAFMIYRQYWWWKHYVLSVADGSVEVFYPENKWLNFKGGSFNINVWQVENTFDLGSTFWERWFFKRSRSVTVNGPGDEDKAHFKNMKDVLDVDRLRAVIANNRQAYMEHYRAPGHLG
jgi:hypothetical protein